MEDERIILKNLIKILSIFIYFSLINLLIFILNKKYSHWIFDSLRIFVFLNTFGWIHYKFSESLAFLYNLNPIGPKIYPKFNLIIGKLFLFASFVYIIISILYHLI